MVAVQYLSHCSLMLILVNPAHRTSHYKLLIRSSLWCSSQADAHTCANDCVNYSANDSSVNDWRSRSRSQVDAHTLYLDPARECLNAIFREESRDRTQFETVRMRFTKWVFFFSERRNWGFFQVSEWFRVLDFTFFWTILFDLPLFQC